MAGNQTGFYWNSRTLFKTINNFDARANKAIGAAFEFQATRSEAYMKTNAPWKDDTGNARNTLFAVAKHEGDTHYLLLSHGVPYGIWLELRFSGRFAIVLPAWLMATVDLQRLLGKLFSNMEGA